MVNRELDYVLEHLAEGLRANNVDMSRAVRHEVRWGLIIGWAIGTATGACLGIIITGMAS